MIGILCFRTTIYSFTPLCIFSYSPAKFPLFSHDTLKFSSFCNSHVPMFNSSVLGYDDRYRQFIILCSTTTIGSAIYQSGGFLNGNTHTPCAIVYPLLGALALLYTCAKMSNVICMFLLIVNNGRLAESITL